MRLSLTIALCLLIVACKTAHLTSQKYEGRTATAERADTLVERDSLVMFVHEKGDTVRIVQREIKWKERVTVRHDTLTVTKTDTLTVTEPKIRSPTQARSDYWQWLQTLLTKILIIIILITILKFKKLWDR